MQSTDSKQTVQTEKDTPDMTNDTNVTENENSEKSKEEQVEKKVTIVRKKRECYSENAIRKIIKANSQIKQVEGAVFPVVRRFFAYVLNEILRHAIGVLYTDSQTTLKVKHFNSAIEVGHVLGFETYINFCDPQIKLTVNKKTNITTKTNKILNNTAFFDFIRLLSYPILH